MMMLFLKCPPNGLGLKEKFHFYTSNLNDVMVDQQARLGIQHITINNRKLAPLHVGNKITMGALGNHRNLKTRLTKGG
jgi:hypothetical protein